VRAVAKDREYYRTTHGGVTLSGGEPLAQNRTALLGLLKALKKNGFHVAVETAGDVPWATFKACLPFVDLFLFDVKVAGDESLHESLTGRKQGRILANLDHLVAARANLRFRMCIVPGLNDATSSIEGAAALLRSAGHSSIELMRYYNLHERKARRLDLPQEPLHITDEQSISALERAAAAFRSLHIEAQYRSSEAALGKAEFSPRVRSIHQAIRDAGYAVCMETAELKTAFHEKNGFEGPLAIRRARLLKHLLANKKVIVYPDELLVGNYTSKRVGGNVWVDYFGSLMVVNLWRIDRQKPVSFRCSLAEKVRFYAHLAPFWAKRGLVAHAFPSASDLAHFAVRSLEKKSGFNNNMAGIAHFIVNCERLLRLGTTGIAREVRDKAAPDNPFYEGVLIALEGLEEFARRYAEHLRELARTESDEGRRAELSRMADVCSRVPANPAGTFHEALQSLLFLHIALCTESFENAISFGRLDQVLQPYYEADVAAGRLDYESARELLACFILKIDELIFVNDGDTAFEMGKMFESLSTVETVTVGGVDRNGVDSTNDVSYMILDICELKPIGVNMAARIHRNSPDRYVERIAEVYLNGSPMPALFHDEVYIRALRNEYGTSLQNARNYSIVGCVEPVASDDHFANTDSANVNVVWPFLQALKGATKPLWRGTTDLDQIETRLADALRSRIGNGTAGRVWRAAADVVAEVRSLSHRANGHRHDPPASMDELLARFQERLNELVRDVLADQQRIESALARTMTTPLASSLYRGCIERGKDVYEGGADYNSSGIQAVGVTDVADSLIAIDDTVFRKRLFTLDELIAAIDADFEGERNQEIRRHLDASPKFGDDSSTDAHLWVNRVLQMYVNALRAAEHPNRDGKYVAGYYGLNTNMVYGRNTPSLPSGRLRGGPLANSICPHFGMQMVDLTSALNAVAKVDFARFAPNGTTLTSTIDSGIFPGREGVRNLAGLIRGYFDQGGMQFQPNLVDREILLDAYRNPGKHKDLVVRIAGYCAYFDDLSDELKMEIINRSYYSSP
jgi:formate C-acetyltransferase